MSGYIAVTSAIKPSLKQTQPTVVMSSIAICTFVHMKVKLDQVVCLCIREAHLKTSVCEYVASLEVCWYLCKRGALGSMHVLVYASEPEYKGMCVCLTPTMFH